MHSMGANLWRCDVCMLVESKLVCTDSTHSSPPTPTPRPARAINKDPEKWVMHMHVNSC